MKVGSVMRFPGPIRRPIIALETRRAVELAADAASAAESVAPDLPLVWRDSSDPPQAPASAAITTSGGPTG